ncbi:MAG: FkbM family methyltransferase [Halioglobus sp.]
MNLKPQCIPLMAPGLEPGLSMYIHGEQDRHVSRKLREEGIWEPYESSLVLELLQPGHVFVDVGANIGYFSLLAATRVGDAGAVFAFEPDPANFELFMASTRHNNLSNVIRAEQAGLAAKAGQAMLHLSEDNLGDHQIFATDASRKTKPIKLLQGSQYLGSLIGRMDLLKVDTQGSEYGVIQGLMPLLQSLAAPPRIIIELTPLSLRQCGSSGRALISLLAELGQPMWIIDHIEHRTVRSSTVELSDWCDNVDAVPADEGFMNILVGQALP